MASVYASTNSRSARRTRFREFDIPFVGTLDFTLNGTTHGRTFFDHLRHDCGFLELWAGPLRIEYGPDRTLRPTTGLYLFALAVVGWTEGHWWHLPFWH